MIELPGGGAHRAGHGDACHDSPRSESVCRAIGVRWRRLSRAKRSTVVPRGETVLGVVTTVITANDGRFSLALVTTLPFEQISSTATAAIQLPRLAVVVAQGSVTVERAGISTTLSAGQEHIFVDSISGFEVSHSNQEIQYGPAHGFAHHGRLERAGSTYAGE